MTEIRWKNGGPLFLQPSPGNPNGLVATNQDCCCPPPPPPRCWECFDVCSYVAEVTSPAALASKSSNATCDPPVAGYGQKLIEFMYEELDLPHSVAGNRFFPADASFSVVSAGDLRGGIYGAFRAAAGHSLNGFAGTYIRPDGVEYVVQCGLRAEIIVLESCLPGGTPGPHSVAVFFNVDVFTLGALGSEEQQYRLRKFGYFHISSTCVSAPKKQCFPNQQEISLINTPLEISADKNGTSLGAYQDESESWSATPSYGDRAKDIGQALRDALTATFRITSRPNCKTPIPCDCSASLAGTRWSFEGQDFDWNTGGESWFGPVKFTWSLSGSSPNVVYEFHDPDGPVDGNGNPSRLLLRRRVDVYCDTVDGEPTWVVLMRATAFCYDGGGTQIGQSEDSWLGRLLCYEACADDWHAAGDPIPSGEPEDVVYNGRETFDNECPPAPPRPTVLISQIETC